MSKLKKTRVWRKHTFLYHIGGSPTLFSSEFRAKSHLEAVRLLAALKLPRIRLMLHIVENLE